jgi:hypothetical protein
MDDIRFRWIAASVTERQKGLQKSGFLFWWLDNAHGRPLVKDWE